MPEIIQAVLECRKFQDGGSGLEAGVQIYGKRVDATYDHAQRMLLGAGSKPGQDADGSGES